MTDPHDSADTTGFSIIVVHRNGKDMLLQTLERARLALTPGRDEIWVVDNGSTDGSVEALAARFPDIRVIDNGCNRGFAAANNQAIARAKGEFVVLLNNDASVPADILRRFEQRFRQHPTVGVIGTLLVSPDGARQRSYSLGPRACEEVLPRLFQRVVVEPPDHGYIEVDAVVGACFAVRAAAIREAGPLDGDFFFYFEEVEWCHRLRRHGWSILLDCDIRVQHLRGISTRISRRGAQVEMQRSQLLYYRKVFSPMTARLLTAHRVASLTLNFLSTFIATVVSFGLWSKPRAKLLDRGYILLWYILGKPTRWGLPGKCPPSTAEPR